jgi:hypothetical protein
VPVIGIQFEVIYADNDLMQIRVSAWNGAFGGAADVYAGIGQIEEFAGKLKGFPNGFSDTREVILGAFGPQSAGGAVNMLFYCADRACHAYVDSKIESGPDSTGKVQFVTCSLPVEAAAVDSFVEELFRLGVDRAGQAYLRGNMKLPQ